MPNESHYSMDGWELRPEVEDGILNTNSGMVITKRLLHRKNSASWSCHVSTDIAIPVDQLLVKYIFARESRVPDIERDIHFCMNCCVRKIQ